MSFTPTEDRSEMYANAAARIEQRSAPVATPERTPPRESSGQFSPNERATGLAGLERAAGYKPLKEDRDEPDGLTVRDAATDRAKDIQERPIETHESGLDEKITLSAEQAAKRVAEARKADVDQAELDGTKAAQNEIDKLRGETPETKARQTQQFEAEPDIEKALSHPKVRDAISAKVTQAETQREIYESSVKEVGKARVAALFSDYPELINVPLEKMGAAINAMGQRDLPRARAIAARLHGLAEVENAMIQIKAQKDTRDKAEFTQYSARENKRFAEMTKGMPPVRMQAVQAEIPNMLREYGVADARQFLTAIQSQTTFPRASAERIMMDAALYRLAMRAAKPSPTHALPPVQRPGVAQNRGSSASGNIAALNQKLSATGDLKTAAKLLAASRAAAKRGR